MTTINLFCGDCLEVLKTIPDESVHLTVTSPPYDNLRKYNGYSWSFEEVAKELYRVTCQSGVVVWVVNDQTINGSESGTSFKQALYFKEVVGFKLHDTMIYSAYRLPLTHKRYEQQFEYMFILVKGQINTFNGIMEPCTYAGHEGATYGHSASFNEKNSKMGNKIKRWKTKDSKLKGNIWHYPVGWMLSSKDRIAFQHPAIFPEQLAYDHIISWSNEGDWVLDPFMGSGTTGKMARLANRQFIGIEIDPKYFEIAVARINQKEENPQTTHEFPDKITDEQVKLF